MKLIRWFLSDRWTFKKSMKQLDPNLDRIDEVMQAAIRNNVCGCRNHPVIYNDMRRILRGRV
ncbi:hypothetical protein XBP1_1630001 [Xenorhabdus bovienii str. puntauvense]|uniref:Uncharacterized protein n=2 Tax=Xenorhabdus bovienii TaxID=40576 RepID=A0A077NC48_XENBV|nr:hypothetical protein XBP1_1630001 [Xenorhabdus bovienii str. puntauvense]CDG99821.1 hypothetical protein XBFM1_1210011 [Xenorhabdus bovienii str. feltiae Moldova]